MASPVRILHLEDNPGDSLLVRSTLEAGGMDCEVVNVDTRAAFVAALESAEFDVVLSDYALPSFGGMEALALTRERLSDLPFLFVSGTMGEELAIESLKAGATDYVLKERLSRLVPSVLRALAEAQERGERREAQERLRASEERYRALFDNASDIVFSLDLEGNFTSVNQAAERIAGYGREEVLGTNVSRLLTPGSSPLAREMLERRAAGETGTWIYRLEIVSKDGRTIPLEVSSREILEAGRLVGIEGIARDITERVQLEAQLRQSQKMEAVGRLAGGVAHDFNNLLTTILGYTDLLGQRLTGDKALMEDVGEIRKAAERASSLTRQLLAFSRKQVLAPVVFGLNAVVADLEKMLRRLIGEDVELLTVPDPELGQVRADPGQIEQVIVNLVVNSRDAMPEGGKITIETSNVDLDDSFLRRHAYSGTGSHVLLAVSDTGSGMDAATRSHIFEPFFTTKGPGKGTGLGLSTVYGIVQQSGGHIEVYSELGHGTVFKVYLPRVSGEGVRVPPSVPAKPAHGTETILLVEDEEAVRALARRILEQHGYRVLEASSPEEATSLAGGYPGPLHLLVTDAVMPGGSGPELARRLEAFRPEMKVLLISGYTDDAVVRQGLLEPTEAFLQKPFSVATLTSKVREVLDRSA